MTGPAANTHVEAAADRGFMPLLALLPNLIVTTGTTQLLPMTRTTG